MNNSTKIPILISIFVLVFLSGVFVTVYETFPFSFLKSLKTELTTPSSKISYESNDVLSLIRATDSKSIQNLKTDLNLFVNKIKITFSGGSSKIFNNEFEASLVNL